MRSLDIYKKRNKTNRFFLAGEREGKSGYSQHSTKSLIILPNVEMGILGFALPSNI
jgi:hypothetical protein